MVSRPGRHLVAQRDKALAHIVGDSYHQSAVRTIPEKSKLLNALKQENNEKKKQKTKLRSKPSYAASKTVKPSYDGADQDALNHSHGQYKDDLEFLNSFKKEKIAMMDPVFKNSGRGSIRADKISKEEG